MRQFVARHKCFKTPRQELTFLLNECAYRKKRGIGISHWTYQRIKELEVIVG